ncbi:hypothetical protein [Massilia aquatica]|uniref:Peptidase M50 domain-containing protein n=1 Tax=Massilia aquatica TaxID=2609000 RepID=A0ABX0MFV7_9BURK|nr:hypothetical protein [Massilia aquatica]NHZ42781.1 hypothetical protein [Massilia aquatica]
MTIFLTLCLSWAIASYLPILVAAWIARSFGVVVEQLTLGTGPVLMRRKPLVMRLLPINASVQFKHCGAIPAPGPHDRAGSLDARPVWVQLLIAASVPACLLEMAWALLGGEGLDLFRSAVAQCVRGALSPLSEAQSLLAAYHTALAQQSFGFVLGLTAAKMAAFNLLPTGFSAGYQCLEIVAQRAFPQVQRGLIALTLLMMGSWLVAVCVYLMPLLAHY